MFGNGCEYEKFHSIMNAAGFFREDDLVLTCEYETAENKNMNKSKKTVDFVILIFFSYLMKIITICVELILN